MPWGSFGGISGTHRATEQDRQQWEPGMVPTDAALASCPVPPLQNHLSLMKCFPLYGQLAHAATQQLLSDKEGVGGQANRQVGLDALLSD